MTPELEAKIRSLAGPANPTDEQIAAVLRGWEDLFYGLGLEPHEQAAEFDAIMRARVSVGVVSLVADRFIGNDASPTRLGGAFMLKPPFYGSERLVTGCATGDHKKGLR